jgi:FHS family glucose/mannose:H+ symporter-like MFS transporter
MLPTADRRLAAGITGSLTLFVIGWTGLLVPTLIRSIKQAYDQTDAGIGVAYFAYSVAYATGSVLGGQIMERIGRRAVLVGAAVLHGVGIAGFGLAPSWPLFLVAMLPAGVGAGCLDGGSNGLVLDVYRDGRGRAMNLLHVWFSVGALLSPLLIGRAVEGGLSWEAVMVLSALPLSGLAVAYALVPMPSGRRGRVAPASSAIPAAAGRLLSGPLILLGVAIASYVAAEIGVSNWLVRFLEPAPIATATLALSLTWAGATVGRLLSSVIADRFDHLRFTLVCIFLMGLAIGLAIAAPTLPLSIAMFTLAGVASGPVFPMIVALGGERYPDRSAAVGGALVGCAVVGSTIYPPAIGFLSVTVGLPIAMAGNALLCLVGAAALVAFGRTDGRATDVRGARPA